MTEHELIELKDILAWASAHVKTDGLYLRMRKCKEWVERDLKMKRMNPTTAELIERAVNNGSD